MMKNGKKIALWVGGLLLLAVIALPFLSMVFFIHGMNVQMKAGKAFMDSLTDSDVQTWIIRADKLLTEQTNTTSNMAVPEDLKKLKILRIDVAPHEYVRFVWVGGMDHTFLTFSKGSNGEYTVDAQYDDNRERHLWPK